VGAIMVGLTGALSLALAVLLGYMLLGQARYRPNVEIADI